MKNMVIIAIIIIITTDEHCINVYLLKLNILVPIIHLDNRDNNNTQL